MMKQLTKFDLLNRAAQRQLHLRIYDADGSIEAVAREIYGELGELERAPMPASDIAQRMREADRDYLVAQLTYLRLLARSVTKQESASASSAGLRSSTALQQRTV